MDKEDARKLSPERQKEKRKIALRMRMNGHEFTEIGEAVGVHPRTVQYWWQRYQNEGLKAAVEGGQRGHEVGKLRTLSTAQEWVVQQLISEKMSGSRFATNMISTVTNQGKVRFMLYRETLTASVLIRFLARLIRDTGKKVFLILDNLKVHHSKKVREWLEKYQAHIELFFLSAYSPELNPDEYLNCDPKAQRSMAVSRPGIAINWKARFAAS